MGGGQIVYVFPFFLGGKGNTINKIPRKSQEKGRDSPGTVPGQSRDNPVNILFMCLLVYWFFPALSFAVAVVFYYPCHVHKKTASSDPSLQ